MPRRRENRPRPKRPATDTVVMRLRLGARPCHRLPWPRSHGHLALDRQDASRRLPAHRRLRGPRWL